MRRKMSDQWASGFTNRVNTRIDELGYNKRQIAMTFKIDRKLITGERFNAPSCYTLIMLSEILKCSTDYLLGLEDINGEKLKQERQS